MLQAFEEALRGAWIRFGSRLLASLPNFLAMTVILLSGLAAAVMLRWASRRVLRTIKFDEWCERSGLSQVSRQADLRLSPANLLAQTLFWLVLFVFAVVGLGSLDVPVVNRLVEALLAYLPRVLSAFVILLAGLLLASFLARTVLVGAVNANLGSPRLLASAVRFLIIVLTLAMALEQVSLGTTIVVAGFCIVFGGVTLALAIAFGLAGREAAAEFIRRQFLDSKGDRDDGITHV